MTLCFPRHLMATFYPFGIVESSTSVLAIVRTSAEAAVVPKNSAKADLTTETERTPRDPTVGYRNAWSLEDEGA
jgi:hypothetical protein